MTHYQKVLSENLKRIRKEKKLSQVVIAERSGVITSTYSRVESCQVSPNLSTLEKLAEAMEVPMAEFFREEQEVELTVLDKLESIDAMSEYNQNVVTILLDSIIEKDRVEKLQEVKMKNRLVELETIRNKK
ncbi:helix-turn-helix transcriptional regulator [uncultured Kordia sp.]|uniref:helix-turn-helix domain-containing protein n=1 Tax=uncultured Kordia sp. TaxID=507699 RepID=UPI002615D1BD|nr:helix-turn-helix transcriptional regulator [uncultured Kordia sp.]